MKLRLLSAEPGGSVARLHDNNFDALRLLFACAVVAYHIDVLSPSSAYLWLEKSISATVAVQGFFVVSGFLVTMSCETSSSLWSYAVKRFLRIAPAYVTVVVLAALALSLLSTLPAREYFAAAQFHRYLAYNLILSNFVAPSLPGVFASNLQTAVNGSLWTIKVEVGFYIAVPFMVWAVRKFNYQRVVPTLFVASLLWRIGLELFGLNPERHFYTLLAHQLPGQLCFFLGGVWVYYRARAGHGPSAIGALAGLILYCVGLAWSDSTAGIAYDLVAPAAITLTVLWAALSGPRLPRAAKYGDFSYGVYLYHFPIVQSCIALGLFSATRFAPILVPLLVVACSAASWFLVESPALSIKRLLSRAPPTKNASIINMSS
jgi:peptidoglycan/LPS O-acetylase OafA/YrhL